MTTSYLPTGGGPWNADDSLLCCDGFEFIPGHVEAFNTVDGDTNGPHDPNADRDKDEWFGRRDRRGSRI